MKALISVPVAAKDIIFLGGAASGRGGRTKWAVVEDGLIPVILEVKIGVYEDFTI